METTTKIESKRIEKNSPVKKFSTGAITATVWNNESLTPENQVVEFRTVSFDRRYKDKQTGLWKSTSTLRIGDLPKAALVLRKAYEYLTLRADADVVGAEHGDL